VKELYVEENTARCSPAEENHCHHDPTSTVAVRRFHCCKVLRTRPSLLGVSPAMQSQAWGQLSQVSGTNHSRRPASTSLALWLQKPFFHFIPPHWLLNSLI